MLCFQAVCVKKKKIDIPPEQIKTNFNKFFRIFYFIVLQNIFYYFFKLNV